MTAALAARGAREIAVNDPGLRIEHLDARHWREYKTLRLEALRLEPAAFSSTYEETRTRPDEWWQARLADSRCATLMGLAGETPVGTVTACRDASGDHPDVGMIFGMYVNARYRRQGIGRALLIAAIDHLAAFAEITTIHLFVTPTQHPARELYQSLGFRIIAEPDGQAPGAEYLMERPARPPGSAPGRL